jgi:DNA-binding MarR family transcriptional regulator
VKLEDAIKSNKFKNETHKAGLNILYTAWWIKTLGSNQLKKFDLTHEQYNVLRILKGKYPEQMCVKEIACRLIEKSSNVPRIIDRLEFKQFIKRTQSKIDGRQTVITITLKGISILEQSTTALNNIWDNNLFITENEAATLSNLLEKLRTKE